MEALRFNYNELKELIDNCEKKKDSDFVIPEDHPVECNRCDWKGEVKDCETETDQEGWEMPEYQYHACPECGECIDY